MKPLAIAVLGACLALCSIAAAPGAVAATDTMQVSVTVLPSCAVQAGETPAASVRVVCSATQSTLSTATAASNQDNRRAAGFEPAIERVPAQGGVVISITY